MSRAAGLGGWIGEKAHKRRSPIKILHRWMLARPIEFHQTGFQSVLRGGKESAPEINWLEADGRLSCSHQSSGAAQMSPASCVVVSGTHKSGGETE